MVVKVQVYIVESAPQSYLTATVPDLLNQDPTLTVVDDKDFGDRPFNLPSSVVPTSGKRLMLIAPLLFDTS